MSKLKKSIIWLVIIVVIIGAVFYFRSRKPKTEYSTEEASKVNVIQTVSVTGEIVSENQVDLAFNTSGEVKKIYAAVGDKARKNQLIASEDISGLLIDFKEAEKDIAYQKKTLANMKRRKSAYNREQEDAQRALVEKAKLASEDIEKQIREKSIYSPMEGIIIRKNIEAGEMAIANSAIFTIAEEGKSILESNIPESDIIKISVGQKASVTLDAFPSSEIFEAEIFEIETASTVIQDVVYYKTKLRFTKTDPRFKNGMSADIDVKTAEKSNVLAVPARAIKMEGSRKYAEVLTNAEKGEIEKKFIETGLEGDEGLVEIVSGLNEGEKVITLIKSS